MSRLILVPMWAVLLAGTLIGTTPVQAQTTWYVDDNAPNDPGPGDPTVSDPNEAGTPEHPFDAIQEAVLVCEDGDTVLVLRGTYTGPFNRGIDLGGLGITVQSEYGPGNCVIDCEEADRGFVFRFGEGPESRIQGFTIANGRAYQYGGGGVFCYNASSPTIVDCWIQFCHSQGAGAGICCMDWSSPIVTNCRVQQCLSDEGSGGGIACIDGSDPTVSYCLFENCDAHDDGGGVFCSGGSNPTLIACDLISNQAVHGGGVYATNATPRLIDCAIAYNESFFGGGCYLRESSEAVLTACAVWRNLTGFGSGAGDGGALYTSNSSVTLTNCLICDNEASPYGEGHGGGVYSSGGSLGLVNCVVALNSAGWSAVGGVGGGAFCTGTDVSIANCTFADNVTIEYGGALCMENGSSASVVSSIMWGDEASVGPELALFGGSNMLLSHSDIEGAWPLIHLEPGSACDWGLGNIWADPQFGSLYCLTAMSPCIDAADNNTVPLDTLDLDGDGDTDESTPFDFDGRLRFADRIATPDMGNGDPPVVDMGAYEYQCTGDVDGSGLIGLSDLGILLANYGTTSGMTYIDGDLDCDGDVDLGDLGILLSVYGTTCE